MANRKLVMEEHGESVLVGVMQDGCDPFIRTVTGDLAAALEAVPGYLREAQEHWAVSPKNPAHVPAVPAKPAAAATSVQPEKAEDLPLLSGAAPVEEVAKAEAEVTDPQAAPAETEPEPTAVPAEPVAVETAEGATEEDKAADIATMQEDLSQREAEAPEPQPAAKPGECEYYLQDGRGPYETIQEAMDELGLDKNTRPQHNRWDRLSTALKEKIQRRPKA